MFKKVVMHLQAVMAAMEVLFLVVALSIDALVSGFAYGTKQIKLPFLSVATINLICGSILGLFLLLGKTLGSYVPSRLAVWLSFTILCLLGIVKVFDSAMKNLIRKKNTFPKKIRFSFLHLKVILNIYADPEKADADQSSALSVPEAAWLALALSLDGMAVGFGAGIAGMNPLPIILFSVIADMTALLLGCWLGNQIAKKISLDFSWLGGVLLILLAISKVI